MDDYVFSQLEDLSNESFEQFSPYSPPSPSSVFSTSSSSSSPPPIHYHHHHHHQNHHYYNHQSDNSLLYDSYSSDYPNSPTPHFSDSPNHNHNHQHQQQPPPLQINVKSLYLHDHNGHELNNQQQISDISLKMFSNFFGLEYNDSIHGRAISQFYPTDIITIVRQSDRVGLFFQFRRFLTSKLKKDNNDENHHHHHSHNNNFSAISHHHDVGDGHHHNHNHNHNHDHDTSYYYVKDSPFVRCMNIVLEFVDEIQIFQIFHYVLWNENLSSTLKMVYDHWMFCANVCTASDVHLISLASSSYNNNNNCATNRKNVQYGINACSSAIIDDGDDADTSDVEDRTPQREKRKVLQKRETTTKTTKTTTKFGSGTTTTTTTAMMTTRYNWAKSAKINAQNNYHHYSHSHNGEKLREGVRNGTRPQQQQQQQQQQPISVIDLDMIERVLPPQFRTISPTVQHFALHLLKQCKLLPFQFTVQLCNALAIAETDAAKWRAKSLLHKMSTYHDPVQLRDISQVARYLLLGNGNNHHGGSGNGNGNGNSSGGQVSGSGEVVVVNNKMVTTRKKNEMGVHVVVGSGEESDSRAPSSPSSLPQTKKLDGGDSGATGAKPKKTISKRTVSLVSETTDYGESSSLTVNSAHLSHNDKCAIM